MHRDSERARPDAAIDRVRRRLLAGGAAVAGLLGLAASPRGRAEDGAEELRFPGDPAEHKVVYQFNKAEAEYHSAVLFSVGAMLRKYGDNIEIAVVAFGPGIHILAKNPGRPVSEEVKQRVSSLSQYGIRFIACGNTMKALNWTEDDILPFAEVVEVGAAALLELQEEGYSYISW
jgi:intracellular sulfur oxidation DsrE/DsrF family protein